MKTTILFDPSQATSNVGDFIINEAVMNHMQFVFKDSFLLRYPTHTPLLHVHQTLRKTVISENCKKSDLKFLGGTNIFKKNLMILTPDWNINIFTMKLYKGVISLGCGVAVNKNKTNVYTRYIYKNTLSKKYVHSTRDEKTKKFLEDLGFSAINTGCPTTWSLTEKHCATIPSAKSNRVIFTLTDYDQDKLRDQKLIDILVENYKEVLFWVQGSGDLEYYNSFQNTTGITVVSPSLEAYRSALTSGAIDYIGTRLHAGIFAMQHSVRSIILIVDNRARDMHNTYNINALERGDIDLLEAKINSDFVTRVKINEKKINLWKSQFREEKSKQ